MFYINRGKVKADGTTAIMYRITIDGKNSVITTGLYCKPEDWSSKKGMVKEDRTNRRLSQYRQDIQKKYGELLKRNGVVSAELLKNAITGVNELPVLLLRSGEVEREKLKIRAKEINSNSSYRESKSTQLFLEKFVKSRGMEDIAMNEITEEFGESYKIFLKKVCNCSDNRVNKCLCWLNRLLYLAVDRGNHQGQSH